MNKRLLTLLFFGVLMGALDIAILGPALKPIKEYFIVSDRQITWIINIYVLANLVGTPLLSKLSDIYGRRAIYISSVFLFGVGSLVVIFSNHFDMLVIGRGIQGFGAGGFFPVASAVIGDTFPKEKQGSALGLIGAVFGLAFIVGPMVGGLLLMIGWRWIFVLNIPMAIVLIIASIRLIPSKRVETRIKFDWLGMLLLLMFLGLFSFSINQIDTRDFLASFMSAKVLPYFLLSLLVLPVFIWLEVKEAFPVINTALFRSKQLVLSYLLAFGAGLGEVGVMFIPGYAKSTFGLSASAASFALIPLLVTLLIGAPMSGRMLDKIGSKPVLLFGTLLITMGLIGLWHVSGTKSGFYISEAILGLGLSAVLGAPLRYIVNHETTDNDRASGQGILSVFISIGQLLSAALVGALIASLGGDVAGYTGAFGALAIVSVIMVVATISLKAKSID
jgi:EmrB/QacA subfamily drug resistance transporter